MTDEHKPSSGKNASYTESLDYIRANRNRYTSAAIRQKLLDAGHEQEVIDEAGRFSDAEVQAERRANTRDLRGWVALIGLAAYAGTFLVFLLFSNLRAVLYGGPIALAILAGVLFIGLLISVLVIYSLRGLKEAPRTAIGSAVLGGLAVPLIILFVIAGLCAVTTGAFGPSGRFQ